MKLKHSQWVLLACACAAMPAHAHALGIGLFVAVLLLFTWPIVLLVATIKAGPGRRLIAFVVTLVAYPVTYFLIEMLFDVMVEGGPGAKDDAQWGVMWIQWGIWFAILIFLSVRARKPRATNAKGGP